MVEVYIHDDSLTWEELQHSPSPVLRWLPADPRARVRVLRARQGAEHVPFVAIRDQPNTFRSSIGTDTDVRVFIDVVTALPFPTPFAYVLPIVVDDPADAYWALCHLPLLRIHDGNPEMRSFREAQARHVRQLVSHFCDSRRCGFLIVDDAGAVLKAEMITFDGETQHRLSEIKDVLAFIERADQERTQAECEAPMKAFERSFCCISDKPGHVTVKVPMHGSLKVAAATIFPLVLDNNRLISRFAVRDRESEAPPDIDIFVSHAHADSATVDALTTWLLRVWPDLSIIKTTSTDEDKYRQNAGYFFDLARRARCVLYIATSNSVDRRMVDTEIGTCADKPIVSVALDGVTVSRLREKSDNSLFLNLDPTLMVDGQAPDAASSLVRVLTSILRRTAPQHIPQLLLPTSRTVTINPDILAYLEDWLAITSSRHGVRDIGTAQSILRKKLLDDATRLGLDVERIRSLVTNDSPHGNLLMVLLNAKQEHWDEILNSFPVLLDEQLLMTADVTLLTSDKESRTEHDAFDTLRRHVGLAVVAKQLETLSTWALERGERFLQSIGIHPKLLEYFDHTTIARQPASTFDMGFHRPKGDAPIAAVLERLSPNQSGHAWFLDALSERIANGIARSNHGLLIYSVTDFNSEQLATLAGSEWLEAKERNPRLGMRGLIRLLEPSYRNLVNWELEACLRAANSAAKVAIVFPLARTPDEFSRGVNIVRNRTKSFAGIGMTPESQSSVLMVRQFVIDAAKSFKEDDKPMLLIVDLEALWSGLMMDSSMDTPSGMKLLTRVVGTLVAEAQAGQVATGVRVQIGMSSADLNRFVPDHARFAMTLAKKLSFLVEDPDSAPADIGLSARQ